MHARRTRTGQTALQHLDSEFAELAATLTAALARKRPSPLASGRPATWAAAILFVLARTNFLFDKTQTPLVAQAQLARACGVSARTASNKAREIENRMDIIPMLLPRELQEKAVAAGAIPFLP